MRQQPRKTKYRKARKGRVPGGVGSGGLGHGDWGLRAAEGGRLSARQLEAARRALRRRLQRRGRLWSCQFPWLPVSGKPAEVRRGKGKGAVAYWATRVVPGARLFELAGVSEARALSALHAAQQKLPVRTAVSRRRPPVA